MIRYLEISFEVIEKADNSRYANGDNIRFVNLAPIALLSNFKLTTRSRKHLEDINHAQIVSFLHELISSAKDSDDLSFGFDCNRDRKKQELTNIKNFKGKYHLRI